MRNVYIVSGMLSMPLRSLLIVFLLCYALAVPIHTQELEGLLEDTSRAVDIYSALRDPIRGSVRLYLEFFPVHPANKKQDEPEVWAYEVLRGCVFSHHRNFSQTTEVPASKVELMARPGNVWVECPTGEDFSFVKVQTYSGHLHAQVIRVDTIQTERAGAVSACVAPLFSQRPDIHEWMHHYTQLGVNKFYMYVPRLHHHEPQLYEAPHEVWETVSGFNFRHGETHTDPFLPFEHPLAEWRYYSPSNREGYFGQVLMYNECLMRSRYSYDYVMFLDVDEFIYLNATTMGRKAPVSLPAFLRHTFPRRTASLELVTYAYPKNCPASTVSAFVERHKLRDRDIIKHHVKLMVRPKHVQEVFVHFVIAVDEGWQEKLRVKEESAFLKHIIWFPPVYTNCRAYVYEDTGLGPGE